MSLENILYNTACKEHWKRVGVYPHHGVCVPLTALRTETSSGVGEFYDLLPLIDWVKSIGMDVIQLLPLNDTGLDSSPYSAHSSLALDPIYIKLTALPHLDTFKELEKELFKFRRFNETPRLEFVEVKKKKELFLLHYYELIYPEMRKNADFLKFVHENSWVQEYALFMSIKKEQNYLHWKAWPKKFHDPTKLFGIMKDYDYVINYHIFIQYLAFKQMSGVKEYATEKGVFLKGDIPILVSEDSADVWFDRENFLTGLSAGAPPDRFNSQGQYWGFPIFNWDYVKETNYAWWERRLKTAANYYHLYRIDHLVGFFRIWGIEDGQDSINGKFVPSNRYKWRFDGEERLKALISASSMMPMAEDLGIIPHEVPSILKSLGITGTKVMRWQTYAEESGGYIRSENYEPISMTTLSTHDTETLGEWWKNHRTEAKEYAASRNIEYKREFDVDLRYDLLADSHKTASLFHINLLSEYLALIPEYAPSAFEDDRINIPGTNLESNWSYRLSRTLEEITTNKELSSMIRSFTKETANENIIL